MKHGRWTHPVPLDTILLVANDQQRQVIARRRLGRCHCA
jgi:hypothetical protein